MPRGMGYGKKMTVTAKPTSKGKKKTAPKKPRKGK